MLIAAVVAALPVHAAVRHTGLGIALLDGPSSLAKDPRAHVYVIDHVSPGTSFTRHVEVYNDTGGIAKIQLYSDSAAVKNGAFVPQDGHSTNELTSWMHIERSAAELAQGSRLRLAVRFDVPRSASTGEHYGVIFAELPGRQVPGGFSVASRVGIRVYLYVGSGATPKSDFRITTLTAGRSPAGNPFVQAAVKNTGGRALDMSGRLWLRDGPGGLSAGPFPVQLGTTLGIGQTEPVTVTLDKALPPGPWLAHLELQSDLIKHAAEASVTFPTANGSAATPVTAKAVPLTKNRNVLVPFAVGLILTLLVGLILFLLWKRRKRSDEDETDSTDGGSPPAVPGQRATVDDSVRQ